MAVVIWIIIVAGALDVFGRGFWLIAPDQRPQLSHTAQRANDLAALFLNAAIVYIMWGLR